MEKEEYKYNAAGRTDLKSALDSKYISLSSFFNPTQKAALLVYVEDEEDIPFWKELFKCIKEKYSEINVTTLKKRADEQSPEVDNSDNTLLASGKGSLMKVEGLGSNKVVAVDRDYDGLILNYSAHSSKLQNSPYVISTTYYSIENHLLWSGAVNTCLQSILRTKTDFSIDYNNVLKQYNETIKPIILLLLACISHRIATNQKQEYTISDLASDVAILNQDSSLASIQTCQININKNNAPLLTKYNSEILQAKTLLTTHTKYPDALWKVVQGHTLYNFASGYMERIVTKEVNQTIHNIYLQHASDLTKARKEEAKYKKMITATYGSIRERVFDFLYANPIIDYSDIGIKKIIDKIKKL